jgi:hypothetical protein
VTLRIECVSDRRGTRIRLSGEFRSEHINLLSAELERSGPRATLDLEEVTLVDVECIRFLNACEAEGISTLHCAPYIRQWMSCERGSPAPRRQKGSKETED